MNKKAQSFVNLMFEFTIILTINKTTMVTKHTASVRKNVIVKCILNSYFKSALFKTHLLDHLPIIFISKFKRDPTPTDDMDKICTHGKFL